MDKNISIAKIIIQRSTLNSGGASLALLDYFFFFVQMSKKKQSSNGTLRWSCSLIAPAFSLLLMGSQQLGT